MLRFVNTRLLLDPRALIARSAQLDCPGRIQRWLVALIRIRNSKRKRFDDAGQGPNATRKTASQVVS
jgi:hypothetical protein